MGFQDDGGAGVADLPQVEPIVERHLRPRKEGGRSTRRRSSSGASSKERGNLVSEGGVNRSIAEHLTHGFHELAAVFLGDTSARLAQSVLPPGTPAVSRGHCSAVT